MCLFDNINETDDNYSHLQYKVVNNKSKNLS